jgi:hypothetical protein
MDTLTKDQVRQILANAPPGTSPEGIIAALRETHQLEGYGTQPTLNAPGSQASPYAPSQNIDLPGQLPALGGMVGSAIGAPLGPPGMLWGAGLGGAVGRAGELAIKRKPITPLNLAHAGAAQGLLEAGGLGLGAGASGLSKSFMEKALSVSPALAERFGTTGEAIAQTVRGSRFKVTQQGEQAAQAAADAIRYGRNAKIASVESTIGARTLANRVIADAEQQLGRPLNKFERKELVSKVQKEADRILAERTHGVVPKTQPGAPAQPASSIVDQYGQPAIPARQAQPPKPSRYSARETEQIKEVAAANSRGAYKASKEATSVAADPVLSKQIAQGARERLNKIAGVSSANAKLSDMMAAKQAIRRAIRKPGTWTPLHIGPISVGFKVPPKKLGGASLALSSPRFQRILKQTPRLVASLSHLVTYSEPDSTER